jgi:DNA-binding transcriptional MerR regulator/effector-binding domain-containing protein
MRDLIPSGRFAQLTRLTRKALRVYSDQGLLRPVYTDPDSGYHYYSLSQLEEARRVAKLRKLGMPLSMIHTTLRLWQSPVVRRELEQYRQELESQRAAIEDALVELEQLLKLERPGFTVGTKSVAPQGCLSQRTLIAPQDACAFIDSAEAAMLEVLNSALIKPVGRLVARYHDTEEEALWDVEVCQPFAGERPDTLPPTITYLQLPGGTSAFTVHSGECDDMSMQQAYQAVWRWIRDHGHDTEGPPYEVYLFEDSNTADPADYRTEIGWLLR